MSGTESGIVTLANELQPWNARSPISVTESGMDTFANELQPWKAHCPMLETMFLKRQFFRAQALIFLCRSRNLGWKRFPTSCNPERTLKRTFSYVGHGIWDCHACQRAATMERTFSYLGHGIWDGHICQ